MINFWASKMLSLLQAQTKNKFSDMRLVAVDDEFLEISSIRGKIVLKVVGVEDRGEFFIIPKGRRKMFSLVLQRSGRGNFFADKNIFLCREYMEDLFPELVGNNFSGLEFSNHKIKKAIRVVISSLFGGWGSGGEFFINGNPGSYQGPIDPEAINYLRQKKLLTKTKKSVVLYVRVKNAKDKKLDKESIEKLRDQFSNPCWPFPCDQRDRT